MIEPTGNSGHSTFLTKLTKKDTSDARFVGVVEPNEWKKPSLFCGCVLFFSGYSFLGCLHKKPKPIILRRWFATLWSHVLSENLQIVVCKGDP